MSLLPAPALLCVHAGALSSSQQALGDVAAVCLALAGVDTLEDEQAIEASVGPWFSAQVVGGWAWSSLASCAWQTQGSMQA